MKGNRYNVKGERLWQYDAYRAGIGKHSITCNLSSAGNSVYFAILKSAGNQVVKSFVVVR